MTDQQITLLDRCPPLPPIAARQILSQEQAVQLESIFKVLANATRLRMLHALVREPELSVSALERCEVSILEWSWIGSSHIVC